MKTILVVEDELAMQKAIEEKLISKGYNVITTKTAEGALLKLQDSQVIDFFWLDHYLPGDLTGAELVTRIKHNEKYKNTPVIIVSNVGWSGRVLSYKDIGISKYFIKANYSLDQIINEIEVLLNQNQNYHTETSGNI